MVDLCDSMPEKGKAKVQNKTSTDLRGGWMCNSVCKNEFKHASKRRVQRVLKIQESKSGG